MMRVRRGRGAAGDRMTRPTAVRQACLVCLGMLTWACGAQTAATLPQADPPAPRAAAVPPPTETAAPEEVARRVTDSRPDPVSRPEADAPVDTDCDLLTAPGVPIRTVALIDAVEASHAPHPTNDGERLLRRGRTVQVDQRMIVDLLRKGGEIPAAFLDRILRQGKVANVVDLFAHRHSSLISASSCWSIAAET